MKGINEKISFMSYNNMINTSFQEEIFNKAAKLKKFDGFYFAFYLSDSFKPGNAGERPGWS